MLIVVFCLLLLSRLKICQENETVTESDTKESEVAGEAAEFNLVSVPRGTLMQTCRSKNKRSIMK